MEDTTVKACVAMGCICIVEGIALLMGYNGTILAAAVATIAGLGGVTVGYEIGISKK